MVEVFNNINNGIDQLMLQEGWDESRENGVIEDALRSLIETIR